MQRSPQQSRLYHKLVTKLWNTSELNVWDGRFTEYGYRNPITLRPRYFSYNSFRNLLKQLDFEFDRDERGVAVSSTKLDVATMNKHLLFLEVLCAEL